MPTDRGTARREFITATGTTHTNSTTEAISGQVTIEADVLVPGDRIQIKSFGTCASTNGTNTLTAALYIEGLAGTSLVTTAATDVADDDMFAFDGWIYIDSVGAAGTFHADCEAFLDTTPASVRTVTIGGSINTTTDTVICVGLDWSVAHADNQAATYELAAIVHRSMED